MGARESLAAVAPEQVGHPELPRGSRVAWWLERTRLLWLPVDPARRRALLSVAALACAVAYPLKLLADDTRELPVDWLPTAAGIVLLFGFACATVHAARCFERLPREVRRHPQVTLHLVFWATLAMLWIKPPGRVHDSLVALVLVLPFLLWRCGYLLLSAQRGRAAGTRLRDHLFYLFPVWGGSNVPFGKGFDYLARHEASTPGALARAQLAGLRLVGLGLLWGAARVVVQALVHGDPDNPVARGLGGWSLGVPQLGELIAGRRAAPPAAAWASIYGQLVLDTLEIAFQGHLYVGVLRMIGFHVPRNARSPLLAQTVVEFWNRFYFYFKELMVDFFFLPTFVRHLRRWPQLRMVAAVFAAAFVGNVYYHLLKTEVALVRGDLATVGATLAPRALYALLLAAGIAVSMRREESRRGGAPPGPRLPPPLRIAAVCTFIALIRVWEHDPTAAGIVLRARFLLSLIGLGGS